MKLAICTLTALLLLSACGNNLRFEPLKSVDLVEHENLYIKDLPREITTINDSLVAFLNANEAIYILNVNSGVIINSICPDINFTQFLEENVNLSDTLIPYDLSKHPNKFVRQYPLFKINAFNYHDNLFEIVLTITNPLYINGVVKIEFESIILTSDINGKIISTELVNLYNKKDLDHLFMAEDGLVFLPDSHVFYIKSLNKKLSNSIVSRFQLVDKTFEFTNDILFPVTDMYTLKLKESSIVNISYVFKRFYDQIYFTNGQDIYSVSKGTKLVSTSAFEASDSFHLIKSFEIIPKAINKTKINHFAYVEDVVPNPPVFNQSNKYLVITNKKGNEIQKRIPIGRIISGLSFQNNRIVFMEEVDDNILIHKYLIK